jgi:adenosylmethionine-8-amino-7-oxononanoate aminotransferase
VCCADGRRFEADAVLLALPPPLLHARIALSPPLIISEAQIDEIADRLGVGLRQLADA